MSAYHDQDSTASSDLGLMGSGTTQVLTAVATMTTSRSAGASTEGAHTLADVGAGKTV